MARYIPALLSVWAVSCWQVAVAEADAATGNQTAGQQHRRSGACRWDPAAVLLPRPLMACPVPDGRVGMTFSPWTPWSFQPFCAGTDYCVFTNAQFAGGHGLSLIGKPDNTKAAVTVLRSAFTDPIEIDDGVDPETGAVAGDEDNLPYEVQDLPGKGKGVIATRFIRRGQLFMFDYASVLADVRFPASVKQSQGQALMEKAVEQLPNADDVLTLGRSSTKGAPVVEDVLRTNTFTAKVDDREYMALFPRISRMNHACKPNAFTNFIEKKLAMRAVAFRDIHPGEEINISYADFGLTFKERQNILLRRWGFRCTCSLCNATHADIVASDRRRKRLIDLRQELMAMVNNLDYMAAIEAYPEVMALVEHEGLAEHMGEHYEVLARFHLAAGNRAFAEKYALMALDELERFGGSAAYDDMLELREFVQSMRAYRQAEAASMRSAGARGSRSAYRG